ncbi:ABC transporter ATP-binding protein [Noviherbaspirillum sp.]|uniref:ABC transporter ATP-binding protein n=1 Tax=Noviherbaspirillum sp. TaxID=1926288 RepID=UPI002B46224B|nr:ABC transporter ATP-binding protein [Noviherbaspirillum sp.]HJV83344.1 ABC transporter ATP-binding protein [Noviherbaspirillum sp.]
MSGQAILEARDLYKSFGSVSVTRDVTMKLKRGERRALIGPNGAGKTTLVNLLAGRLKPTSGSIMLNGHDVTSMGESTRSRRGLGRTFQITSLFPALTAHRNVFLAVAQHCGIGARLFRCASAYAEQHEEADQLLARVGLSGVSDVPVQRLPYGQQRLLEIAVTLALKPQVLLLDEPAAGIPTSERDIILDIIDSLPEHIAVLLIDHDMDLVFRFAQRITVLVQGATLVEGTPDEIAKDPDVRRVYLGER